MKDTFDALRRLVEEMNLILRGERGYGSGQPWSPRDKAKGLGKSFVEEFVEEHGGDDTRGDGDGSEEEFKVSKALGEDTSDDTT